MPSIKGLNLRDVAIRKDLTKLPHGLISGALVAHKLGNYLSRPWQQRTSPQGIHIVIGCQKTGTDKFPNRLCASLPFTLRFIFWAETNRYPDCKF